MAHVAVRVLAGAAHADRTAILGHVGDDDDLWTAWHAPSFAEDVELNFAKTAAKNHLLPGGGGGVAGGEYGGRRVRRREVGRRLSPAWSEALEKPAAPPPRA